jgi:hypothetical protein
MREIISVGGWGAAGASARAATCRDARVGATGIGPLKTEAEPIWRTTAWSRTIFPATTPPETKVFRLTTVT